MAEQSQQPHGGLSPNFNLADSINRDGSHIDEFELPKAVEAAQRITAHIESLENENAAHKQDKEALRKEANVDPLTGILNRRGLDEEYARLEKHTVSEAAVRNPTMEHIYS